MRESEISSLIKDEGEKRHSDHSSPVLKNTPIMYLWGLGITMASMVLGYSLVLITILGTSITHNIHQNSTNQSEDTSLYLSVCTAALPLGALAGSLLFSKILQIAKGENRLMVICDAAFFLLYAFQSLALSVPLIVFARFLIGFTIGVSGTAVPMYLTSIAPREISGTMGSFNQLLITIGIAVAYGMGFLIDEKDLGNWWRWRVCIILPAFLSLFRLYTLSVFKYDSLERHIERKEFDILKTYVQQFYEKGTYSVQMLISSKQTTHKGDANQSSSSGSDTVMRKTGQLALILTISNQFCGINVIIFYANQLFTEISEGDTSYAVRMSFYMGLFQILITFISAIVVDKFGRRSLILIGEILIIFALLGGFYMLDYDAASKWDPNYATYAIFLHIAGFSISLGPITFIYISEILDDISPYMVIIWIETVLVAMGSNLLVAKYGVGRVFLGFGIISIICLCYFFPTLLETKGKTRNQIHHQFMDSKEEHKFPGLRNVDQF